MKPENEDDQQGRRAIKKKAKKTTKKKNILTLRQKDQLQTFTNLFNFILSFALGHKSGPFL
jgi:hypothetical protein